ncbi:MAG: phosphatase PAP2 family protein, partial [Bacteroidales bacterium]|nr:phosphatase PAP2 family protein [Bacteroidales bacterium]
MIYITSTLMPNSILIKKKNDYIIFVKKYQPKVNTIKKIDILFFIYLFISTIFVVFTGDTASQLPILFIHFFVALFVIGLLILESKKDNSFIKLLRETYPLIFSGYFYSETVFYNQLLFPNLDPKLEQIEAAIFGMQPSVEFSAYISNTLFSELMYFGYFSFYVLILAFTLYVFFHKKEYFKQAVFQLSASLYIFYFLFILFPSAGPQFYFSSPENILPEAYFFEHIMRYIQDAAEQPTGAFPSSHVGISVIILMLSRKNTPVFFKMAWPFVMLVILSTVYIKAHYAIDVIGGLLIAPFILYL